MSLSALPATDIITQKGDKLPAVWQVWFGSLQQWLGPQGNTGTTAARPTKGLYVGLSYFDTTLGYPVFVKQAKPPIWVNATGGVV